MLGGLVIAGTATAVLGLPIGGALVEAWGWRTTFFVNLPVAAAALAMTLAWIPRDEGTGRPRSLADVAARLDLPGIAGFGGTLSALLVFLLGLPRTDWAALAVAVVVAVSLAWWELRSPAPFLDLRLLVRNLALSRTYLRFALSALCVYTVLYGVSQWLEAGRHVSAQTTGLLLPMSGLSALLARPVSARNLIRTPLLTAASPAWPPPRACCC